MTIKVIATIEIAEGGEQDANTYFAATMPMLDAAGAEIIDQMTVDHAVVGDRVVCADLCRALSRHCSAEQRF